NKDILQLSSPTGQASLGVSPDANLKLRTVLQRAAKRIDGKFPNEPEVEMRLRYTIGFALNSVGDYAGALAQFEKVVSLSQKLRAPDNPSPPSAESGAAGVPRLLGHRDVALPLLEKNVERHKAILGEEDPQTLVAMNGLQSMYRAEGRLDEALELAARVL